MNKQYYGYTRVSTIKQGEGVSLEAQKDAIQSFAEKNNLTITTWFEEKVTAAKAGRPLFNTMIKNLSQGKADGVIIHKIDRSARNISDWAKIGELSDAGIDVHFAAESLDFRSRGGRLTADIQAVIAADYIRNLREETIKGINGRLKQGLYPFKAPIGYLDNGGGKVKTACPVNGPYIKELFERYATGQYSMDMLSEQMWDLGLRSKYGGRIHKSKIDRILNNPFYMGLIHVLTTGATYSGIHTPLISAELFQRVQKIKSGRAIKKKTKHNFLFRSLFQCVACAGSMIGERQRSYVYYRCHARDCPTKTVREEVIEQAVQSVFSQIRIRSNLYQECREFLKLKNSRTSTPQMKPQRQITKAQIKDQKDRLVNALISGTIDEKTYQEKHQELLVRESANNQDIAKSQSPDQILERITKFLEQVKNVSNTYLMANYAEKRQLLEMCFSNMIVDGRSPLIQTKKWLSEATDLQFVPYGGLSKTTNRSGSELDFTEIEDALSAFYCPEISKFTKLCDEIRQRESTLDLPENAIAA